MLGELRRLIVDIGHPNPYCCSPGPRDLPLVDGHHDKLIQVVGSLIVQWPRREDGSMWGDGEVLAEGVIGQLCILL